MIRNASKLLVVLVVLAAAACSDRDTSPIIDDTSTTPGAQPMSLQAAAGRPGRGLGQDADAADYTLASNDHLRITVFGEERLTGEYVLDGSGSLAFPLIGEVNANGMTVKQLEGSIGAKLAPTYVMNPSVSIQILNRRPFYVVGEVQKPGNYPHSPKLNVLTAIATAGGFTIHGRSDAFFLKRTDRDGNIYRIRATQQTLVRPGDVVEVRERYF
jgi:polysaccharide export outer membrane protein